MNIKTFHQWIRDGRVVKRGERAPYRLVSPDGKQSVSAFTLEQTDPYVDLAEGWTDVVAQPEKAAKDTRPKLRIDHQDDLVRIWCGSDERAYNKCQKNGFEYEPKSHRWTATRSAEEFEGIVETFEGMGYNVVVDAAPSADPVDTTPNNCAPDAKVEPYAVFLDAGADKLKVVLRPDAAGMMQSLGFTTGAGMNAGVWRARESAREQLMIALEQNQYNVYDHSDTSVMVA